MQFAQAHILTFQAAAQVAPNIFLAQQQARNSYAMQVYYAKLLAASLTNWLDAADTMSLSCAYDYPEYWGNTGSIHPCKDCTAYLTDAAAATYRYTGKTVTQTTGCKGSCFGKSDRQQPIEKYGGVCDGWDGSFYSHGYHCQVEQEPPACNSSDFARVNDGWMAEARPQLLPLVRAFQIVFTSAEQADGLACACSSPQYGLYPEMNASTCQFICRADVQCAAYQWTLDREPPADHGALVLNYSSPVNGTCTLYDYNCGSADSASPPPPPVARPPPDWHPDILDAAVTCCEADGRPTAGDTCCLHGCIPDPLESSVTCCKYFGGSASSGCVCEGGYKMCKHFGAPGWNVAAPCEHASPTTPPKCSGETCSDSLDCDGELVCGRYNNNPEDRMCCECSGGQCEHDGVDWCKNPYGGDCSDGNSENCQDGLVCGVSEDSSSGYQCCSNVEYETNLPANNDPYGVACYEAFTYDYTDRWWCSDPADYESHGYSCSPDGWCARLGCDDNWYCTPDQHQRGVDCAENKGTGLVVRNGRCVAAVCKDSPDASFTSIGLQYCVNTTSEITFEDISLEQCKARCGSTCNAITWGTNCDASDLTWSGGDNPVRYCDDIGDASCCVQRTFDGNLQNVFGLTNCSAAGLVDIGVAICPDDKTCDDPVPICGKPECKNYQSCAPSVLWRAGNFTTHVKDLSSSAIRQDSSSSCTFVQYEMALLAPSPPANPVPG